MANDTTIFNIINYYANLLIIQYNNKPKARAEISSVINALIASAILFDIRDAFNIDTAVGVQLDTLGKYADIDRFYSGQILDGYFAFTDYNEVTPPSTKRGFSDYSNFETKDGKFLTYLSVLSQTFSLNDDEFRFLLKLRIIQNNSNHSHKSIDDSIFAAFGQTLIPDSVGNMVMDYFASPENYQVVLVAKQKGILPKPMGVGFRYLILRSEPFFGFATYDGYSNLVLGFTDYANYDTSIGETLDYDELVE